MLRTLLAAVAVVAVLPAPAGAKKAVRAFSPLDKLVRADAVVVGKVTALEKEAVLATPAPGAAEKLSYTVAVIKVETAIAGVPNATHVKVGFFPPAPAPAPGDRPVRGGYQPVNLAVGTEGLFYLAKHHTGDFYVVSPTMPPVEAKADDYKAQVALVKTAAAALADPAKALKAEKAADRLVAATVLVTKYRAYPDGGGEVVEAKVPADVSALALKALAEGNWMPDPNDPIGANGYQAFAQLGLGEQDGWKYPVVKPGEDVYAKTREAFTKWLAGPGKDYQIKTWAAKKK